MLPADTHKKSVFLQQKVEIVLHISDFSPLCKWLTFLSVFIVAVENITYKPVKNITKVLVWTNLD